MSEISPFSERVAGSIQRSGGVLCVGLDPRREAIPREFFPRGVSLEGLRLEQAAAGYRDFSIAVIQLLKDLAAAVKPQVAFFEELLEPGYAAFCDVCRAGRESGIPVIADVKRGDIGTTAEAYARAYLTPAAGKPPLADAVTVNPYLGVDGLQPFYDAARAHAGGVFVLVKTSNPSSKDYQDQSIDGRLLHQLVAADVERAAAASAGSHRYGCVGAVVGATHPKELSELRQAMPHAILLVPGFGAQGATAADVAVGADADGRGMLVNASRSVTFPWGASKPAPDDWQVLIRRAATTARDDLSRAIEGRQFRR